VVAPTPIGDQVAVGIVVEGLALPAQQLVQGVDLARAGEPLQQVVGGIVTVDHAPRGLGNPQDAVGIGAQGGVADKINDSDPMICSTRISVHDGPKYALIKN